ncbi:cation diffusion facilitator family transporter [Micromonospora sp. WMMD1102]|uniref:cation diffusion facilitator family transporter n=1 Tax=Micromonospora sp. WMMD1102 TaxID=3016105 RepID=UPI0024151CC1|nr:cation diffusion facilitator family transporter [Micromonospora sp. WMMD1102]MDG4786594.1 cation diffusion facilitator family transporter [Micromonospora sp. WMMD1102]
MDHDHSHGQNHSHSQDRSHDHQHSQHHEPGRRLRHRLGHLVTPHSHDTADKVDTAMETSRAGLRALWISLAVLGATAAAQAVVVALSGSVALLGDTLHNVADALTAVPLGIAFLLGRRAATRTYTYGYGRAEDLAGIAIVATIAASAAFAGHEAVRRLLAPQDVRHLPYVAAAALLGFVGNELVARYRIGVGRRIGSAALVADGLHARADGFTSLAVLLGAGGAALGWRWADPLVGLLITAAILLVLKDAARQVYRRLMDAVDPDLVDRAEATLRAVPGVRQVTGIRMRWIGHRLHAEATLVVDAELSLLQAHEVAADAEHQLCHAVPRLTGATVHTDPASHAGDHHHAELSHRRRSTHRAGTEPPGAGTAPDRP